MKERPLTEEKLFKVDDVAELIKLHPMTVYRLSREGVIPGRVKLGASVRFRESAIRRWIRHNEQQEQPR